MRSVSAMLMYRPGWHTLVRTQSDSLPDGVYLSAPHLVVGAVVGVCDGATLGVCDTVVHAVRIALWNCPVGHRLHERCWGWSWYMCCAQLTQTRFAVLVASRCMYLPALHTSTKVHGLYPSLHIPATQGTHVV